MSNPRERSKRVIAERFFAGETIGELMRDYEESEAFVLEAVREHRLSDNEEAVIEAARKYLKLSKSPPELYVGFLEPEVAAYLNLREALRALNKAEAGDE